jgi:hypothetical protein
MGGACSMHSEMRMHSNYCRKLERKRPLEKYSSGCKDNIKMVLEETECEGML